MSRICQISLAVVFALISGPLVSAQVLRPADSIAAQLLLFDCNGNGRIDAAESAAMQAKQQPDEHVSTAPPLICAGNAFGGGNGGGGTASEATQEESGNADGIHFRRGAHRLGHQREHSPEQAANESLDADLEVSPDSSTNGYPFVEEQPAEPEPLQRSVGLSKAVQYRLLQNRRPTQSQRRLRQAAVFGATQGLVKQDYQVVIEDHCAPARTNLYCRQHLSR